MFPISLFRTISTLLKENQRLSDELRYTKLAAITDNLTGLYNRRAFSEWIERTKNLIPKSHMRWWVAIIDVDRFKPYNDTYGHSEGDIALKQITDTMIDCSRSEENLLYETHLFRWGGEEFLVLGYGERHHMENYLESFREQIIVDSQCLPREITISAGYALLDMEKSKVSIDCADKALYKAKSNRNCVCDYDDLSSTIKRKCESNSTSEYQALEAISV